MASVESLLEVLIEEIQGLRNDLAPLTRPTFATTLDEVNDSIQSIRSSLNSQTDRLMGARAGNLGCGLDELQSILMAIDDNTSK